MCDVIIYHRHATRRQLHPVRKSFIKQTEKLKNKCWQGCGRKETLICGWWKCKLVIDVMMNSLEIPQKLKTK